MTERYPAMLLFGAPGSGKGTQGSILGQIPGFFHLACGDVFRSLNINSPEGREIYKYSSRGELVPDELTFRIWKNALHGHIAVGRYKPPEEILVLDGIPRNIEQARLVDHLIQVLHVFYLVCPNEDAMIDRIKRRAIRENRADDANERVIRHRFEIYRTETESLAEHYPQQKVARIDAIGSPGQVLQSILRDLIPVQQQYLAQLPDVDPTLSGCVPAVSSAST